MSAWFVLSSLGLYAVDPVSATYVLSAPLFDHAVVRIGRDSELVIETKRSSPTDKYIQSVTLNGNPHPRLWIHYEDLVRGAHLVFTLGAEPSRTFGVDENLMPPSLTS
jgi:putative alpha-1,2-mannosidase